MSTEKRCWQDLCVAASKEHDSETLRELVSELVKALDEQEVAPGPAPIR